MTYYLDSNVFIYPALYQGEKSAGAAALLGRIVDGELQGATASLTLDEVIWILSRETDRGTALEQGKRILRMPNLRILDVREREIREGIETMERHDALAPRDAIHLAAMRVRGIERIVSDDEDFAAVSEVEHHRLTEFA